MTHPDALLAASQPFPILPDTATLMEVLPHIVWISDSDGWPTYFNRPWYDYTGLSVEATQGRGWEVVLHPEDRERYLARRLEAVRTGEPYVIETRFRAADFSYRWHLGRAGPVRSPEGQIIHWVGTCTDIHEQKRATIEADEGELRFKSLASNVPGVVYRCALDEHWTMVFISERVLELTGYPAGDFMGTTPRSYASLIHPEDAEDVERNVIRAVQSDETFELEYRVIHMNGEVRWVHERGQAVKSSRGTVEWLDGVILDITHRHQAQQERAALLEQVQAERTLLFNVLEQMPSAVWLAEAPSGRLLLGNEGVRRLWGHGFLPAAEIKEYAYYKGFHPDGRAVEAHEWPLARAVKDGEVVHEQEIDVLRADGSLRRATFSAAPIHNAEGARVAAVVTGTDISERKRAEQAIRALNADLEHRVEARTRSLKESQSALQAFARQLEFSNRELQDFASVASHDLQEPLRKVQAFADRLKSRYAAELGDDGRDYLDRMQAAAFRMQALINDLLSLSRVTSRAQPFGPVDLADIVQAVVCDLEVTIERQGAQLRVGALPVLPGDATQLRQLMQNLIGNALKYHRDTPQVIEVRAEVNGDSCVIEVQDQGLGFDEKYLDRIFTPFQRLHGRGKYEGTGMGLAIVRKIVERHGGTITARSTPGEGSTFIVSLPMTYQTGPGERHD
ncbi:PAS domain-containing sensor histidine kinase [Deinococcus peraridilitoris]|uniref:histidine kinase n=1 Tax=Deinococcus peraridilitoris (strain DSM 19664 / LMG 22246 / CIP 109416 / KR-200) TaxID=937777 RepID=K9ZWW6_DEIPD|nr:PAS domain-containing protein [Deinococcus peraridilitoris]AFZ65669.1 PAS domain S-box [Deinococcus peraridilitoris DSM 19664]